jgi:hypothetical protein
MFYRGDQTTLTTEDRPGSAFQSLREKAVPKTELQRQMQQTSDEDRRSEEELEEEVRQEMIERAKQTGEPEHKDTKLTGYISS